MEYTINKIKRQSGGNFADVFCVCAKNEGDDYYSVIAEVHDWNIYKEHGTPEEWAQKIAKALMAVDIITN